MARISAENLNAFLKTFIKVDFKLKSIDGFKAKIQKYFPARLLSCPLIQMFTMVRNLNVLRLHPLYLNITIWPAVTIYCSNDSSPEINSHKKHL